MNTCSPLPFALIVLSPKGKPNRIRNSTSVLAAILRRVRRSTTDCLLLLSGIVPWLRVCFLGIRERCWSRIVGLCAQESLSQNGNGILRFSVGSQLHGPKGEMLNARCDPKQSERLNAMLAVPTRCHVRHLKAPTYTLPCEVGDAMLNNCCTKCK